MLKFPNSEAQITEVLTSGFLYKIKHLFKSKDWIEYEALPPSAFPVDEDYTFSVPLLVSTKRSQTLLTATFQGPPIDGTLRWELAGKPLFHAGEQKRIPEQIQTFRRNSLVTCENRHVIGKLRKPIYSQVPQNVYEARLTILLAEGQEFVEKDQSFICSACDAPYLSKTQINVEGEWGPK